MHGLEAETGYTHVIKRHLLSLFARSSSEENGFQHQAWRFGIHFNDVKRCRCFVQFFRITAKQNAKKTYTI